MRQPEIGHPSAESSRSFAVRVQDDTEFGFLRPVLNFFQAKIPKNSDDHPINK